MQAVLVVKNLPPVRWITLVVMGGGFAGALAAGTVFHAMPMGLPPTAAAVFKAHEQYASYTLWLSGLTLLLGIGGTLFKLQRRAYELLVLGVALAATGAVTVAGHHGAQLVYIQGIGPQGHLVMKGEHHEEQQVIPSRKMPAGDSTRQVPAEMPKPAAGHPRIPGTTYYMSSSAHWSGGGMQEPQQPGSGMAGMAMPEPATKGKSMGSSAEGRTLPKQGVKPKAKPAPTSTTGMEMPGMDMRGMDMTRKSPAKKAPKAAARPNRKKTPSQHPQPASTMPGMDMSGPGSKPAPTKQMPGMDMLGMTPAADGKAASSGSMDAMPGMAPPAPLYDNNPAWERAHPTPTTYRGKRVVYDLYVNDTLANFTGKKRWAIAVNGHIPAPTLTFTDGDTAVIRVHNRMKMETMVHWHGLLVP